jgi:hypothetical protein
MTDYQYTIPSLAIDRLSQEIRTSSIVTALDHIDALGSAVDIYFKADLSTTDKSTLDTLVASHSGIPLPSNIPQPIVQTDTSGSPLNQYDSDKALIVRQKAAQTGWTYSATGFEFQTAVVNSVIALNADGSAKPWITIALYDANGVKITDPALAGNAVRTQVDFEPTYDYELIGGEMRITPSLNSDVRFFIIAAPDIPAQYGGSKVMAEGLNIRYLIPGNMFQVDGRVSKRLNYSAVNHASKLRFLFWHAAGVVEQIMITVEHYRL